MAIGVIGMQQTLAPATESVLESNNHAVVIGNTFCIELLHSAEPRVRRAVRNRVGTSPRRQSAEAPRVCAGVQNEFVDSMMAEVAEAERSMRAERLLQLQAPPLILGFVGVPFGDTYTGGKKVRD